MLGAPAPVRRACIAALVLASGAAGACVGERPTLATESSSTTTVSETTSTIATPPARVAQANGTSIDIFDGATTASPVGQITAEMATATPGIPIVFLVKGETGDRLEVHLPTPPAGATAWVRRADVTLSSVTHRIEVDLGEHRVRVFDGAEKVLDEPASIGTTDRPAAGTYFLKELLQAPDPTGPYGAYAYGLSGHTTTLVRFEEGAGIVGIHGTNDETSLGADVASGSIGLAANVLAQLVDEIGLPLGTPVDVVD